MTLEGTGKMVFEASSGKSKRYTFTTSNKGFTWTLESVTKPQKE